MSKSSRRKKRRRKHSKPPKNPQACLRALAAALNACADGGVRVKFLTEDTVITYHGAVLPLKGGRWEARMFAGGKGAGQAPHGDDDD